MGVFTCKKVCYGFCWILSLFIKVALKAKFKNVVFGEQNLKEETFLLSGTFKTFLFSLIMLFHKKEKQ